MMLQWERQAILEHLRDVAPNEISEAVESFRSAFLPMHCKPDGGKLYRKGDVAATPGNYEVFSKIQGFFLVKVNDDYQSLVLGDTFQVIIGPDGAAARHPIAQNAIVFGNMYLRLCGLREVGIITKNTNYLINKTFVIGY